MKNEFKSFISGKRITLMGLGVLGRGIGVAKYLASQPGVELLITDLKSASQLQPSLDQLTEFENITYVLERHRLQDFEDCDLLIHGANIPDDNLFLNHAIKNNIQTYMDETLLVEFLDDVKVVGITGTRGKSTTTMMILHILQNLGVRVHLGGNMRGVASLPLLEKLHAGDILVMELSSWQLSDWRRKEESPGVAVFTNFLDDHLNYYNHDRSLYWKDKAAIFEFQKPEDVCIFGPQFTDFDAFSLKGSGMKVFTSLPSRRIPIIPEGEHNQANAVCAIEACKALGFPRSEIIEELKGFSSVEGRLEDLGLYSERKVVNDNNGTTPDATMAALATYGSSESTFLLCGGASKELDLTDFVLSIKKNCKSLILLDNSGTQELLSALGVKFSGDIYIFSKLVDCIDCFFVKSSPGDTLIFSPAFASYGSEFQNEYERNDTFLKIIKKYE